VIGGSSAGATIQGSSLVRGACDGNDILRAKGYEQGFGSLRGVAIDQHILPRNRFDLKGRRRLSSETNRPPRPGPRPPDPVRATSPGGEPVGEQSAR
jgi:hypothetical protein